MRATVEESRDDLIELYKQSCAHADGVLLRVGLGAPARVPWWPESECVTTAAALLARVLKDTAMHAGQMQILRELVDGRAGADRADAGDAAWWRSYTDRLEQVANHLRP